MQVPMELHIGDTIWLPCETRDGPFPNEKRVYVRVGESEWFGFVDIVDLREGPHGQGSRVRSTVVDVSPQTVTVSIHGHSPSSDMIEAAPTLVQEYGALEA